MGSRVTCVNNVVGWDLSVDSGFLLVFSFMGLLALFLVSMFTKFIWSEGQCDATDGSVLGLFNLHFSRSAYNSGAAFPPFPASPPHCSGHMVIPLSGTTLSSLCLSAFAHAVPMLFLLLECFFSSSFAWFFSLLKNLSPDITSFRKPSRNPRMV